MGEQANQRFDPDVVGAVWSSVGRQSPASNAQPQGLNVTAEASGCHVKLDQAGGSARPRRDLSRGPALLGAS